MLVESYWFTFLFLISGMLYLLIALYILKKKELFYVKAFLAFLVAGAFWSLGVVVELNVTELSMKMLAIKIQYIGTSALPVSFFIGIVNYTTDGERPSKRLCGMLFIIPALNILIAWTNEFHELLYRDIFIERASGVSVVGKEKGYWYNIYVAYSYLLLLSGSVLLSRFLYKMKSAFKMQAFLLLVGLSVPWMLNLIFVLNGSKGLDLTPIGFTFFGLAFLFAINNYRLFDLLPAANEKIVEWLEDGVIVLDRHDRIIAYNSSMKKLLNNGDLIGKPGKILFDNLPGLIPLMLNDKNFNTAEVSSSEKIFEVKRAEVLNSKNIISAKVLSFRDITVKKQNENLLKNREQSLKELNNSKDKLISIIAHDLRNPFHGLINYSKILLDNFNDLSDKDKLEILNNSDKIIKNTFTLLENLLTWGAIQRGKANILREYFDLAQLSREEIDNLKYAADNKFINVSLISSDKAWIYADKRMTGTIIRNLLSNAIKFTYSQGKIVLQITPKEKFILIEVKDNGAGIDETRLENLFTDNYKPFTGTAGEKGSGIGLMICKELVEMNDGKIYAESKVGEGSSFYFTVPLSKPGKDPII